MELQNSMALVTGTTSNIDSDVTDLLDVDLDSRVNAIVPFLIDVPGNREAMPDANFSEGTSTEAIVDEVINPLSNEGVTDQLVQMTEGRPEVIA